MSRYSRYNYFDDEPEDYEPGKKSLRGFKISKFDIKALAENAKVTFEDIAHGKAFNEIKELNELPNLKALVLKIFAGVLAFLAVVVFIVSFSHTINTQNKKSHQYYVDAGKVCTEYIKEYGSVKWERLNSDTYGDDMAKMTGLCFARQLDFNNDGEDELMLCYNNKNIYTVEVWGYHRKEFVKFFGQSASSTDNKADGSWIALYRENNKYYICKSETDTPEKADLYALKGDEFEITDSWDYDYKNNIYSQDGEINAQDFETIKFSAVSTDKAENMVNSVTSAIDGFSTVSVPAIEMQKTDEELKAQAYFDVCEKRIERYGEALIAEEDGVKYIDGLAVVKLVDFDGDGNEELLLVYRKQLKKSATNAYNGEDIVIEEPTYCVEVYSWNGAIAQKIFSRDFISNYLMDTDVNYLMLKKNKTGYDICINNYSYESEYTYTASSKIFSLKNGSFEDELNVRLRNNYGYKSYYINSEYSYRSEFEEKAYKVPKFMDDEQEADSSVYTLIYVSGEETNTFDETVNLTVDTLQTLDKDYTPED